MLKDAYGWCNFWWEWMVCRCAAIKWEGSNELLYESLDLSDKEEAYDESYESKDNELDDTESQKVVSSMGEYGKEEFCDEIDRVMERFT